MKLGLVELLKHWVHSCRKIWLWGATHWSQGSSSSGFDSLTMTVSTKHGSSAVILQLAKFQLKIWLSGGTPFQQWGTKSKSVKASHLWSRIRFNEIHLKLLGTSWSVDRQTDIQSKKTANSMDLRGLKNQSVAESTNGEMAVNCPQQILWSYQWR